MEHFYFVSIFQMLNMNIDLRYYDMLNENEVVFGMLSKLANYYSPVIIMNVLDIY